MKRETIEDLGDLGELGALAVKKNRQLALDHTETTPLMTDDLLHSDKLRQLREIFSGMGSVVVAFSGGVDSTFLAKVAYDTLGSRALAVTAVSPSLPASELDEAKRLAAQIGVRHELVESHELSDPRYLANGPDRCYFCKVEVYGLIASYARERGFAAVVDGTNFDDLRDPRPGRKAAREHGVLSPLVEAGFTKANVREASRAMGLPTADKPSMACLSSRIPYGTPVSIEALRQIEAAEKLIREMGMGQLRVRHHQDIARIEVDPEAFPTVIERRDEIVAGLKALGYRFVALDLEGYRTGSMNRGRGDEGRKTKDEGQMGLGRTGGSAETATQPPTPNTQHHSPTQLVHDGR